MGTVTRVVLLGVVLVAWGTAPPVEANIGDRIFSGFLTFGRAFSNATQTVISKLRTLVSPGSTERNRNRPIRDIDVFSSVCSLSGRNRRLLLGCLQTNEETVASTDWQNCVGSARVEVLSVEDLYHWICMQITASSQPQSLQNTTECLLRGIDKPAIMDAIKVRLDGCSWPSALSLALTTDSNTNVEDLHGYVGRRLPLASPRSANGIHGCMFRIFVVFPGMQGKLTAFLVQLATGIVSCHHDMSSKMVTFDKKDHHWRPGPPYCRDDFH